MIEKLPNVNDESEVHSVRLPHCEPTGLNRVDEVEFLHVFTASLLARSNINSQLQGRKEVRAMVLSVLN